MKRNFPEARAVSAEDKVQLGRALINIAKENGMTLRPCAEGDFLEKYGADCGGCMTIAMYERAIGSRLIVPKSNLKQAREECACYLNADIGSYDTCRHYCRYCYANNDLEQVARNQRLHNPKSPLLIGELHPEDEIHPVKQRSWRDNQMSIFDFC